MKTLLFSLLLFGCTGSPTRHNDNAPAPFVESQIQRSSQKIALAQERLQQSSGMRIEGAQNKHTSPVPPQTQKKVSLQKPIFSTTGNSVVKKTEDMPQKPLQTEKTWRAERGSTLKDTLSLWVSEEKCAPEKRRAWHLVWDTDTNYRIDAPLPFSGTFRDALNGLFRLYAKATVPLFAGINTTQCLLKVDDQERHS
ncbi:toxin co-regulated pilus biosynthesis Q family protein [Candidatus Williamhamiltonella defendens]|uniref:toxin co-regulated pilus biosynthesis Q family protein n=1 Tax=Candidatus Williamhamiltonella defendens TaxID=138072 RepID=UPI001F348051|nr:toxin co-regulated pilus biosynthesis Q family protein [Candidatus Hamiltonella defensa]